MSSATATAALASSAATYFSSVLLSPGPPDQEPTATQVTQTSRRQNTIPRFYGAGVRVKVHQARICLDCDAELRQSGGQPPGPEQQDAVHY